MYLRRGGFGASMGCVSTLQIQTIEKTHVHHCNLHDISMCVSVVCDDVCIAKICRHYEPRRYRYCRVFVISDSDGKLPRHNFAPRAKQTAGSPSRCTTWLETNTRSKAQRTARRHHFRHRGDDKPPDSQRSTPAGQSGRNQPVSEQPKTAPRKTNPRQSQGHQSERKQAVVEDVWSHHHTVCIVVYSVHDG